MNNILTQKNKKILKTILIITFIIYIAYLCINIAVNTDFNTAPDEFMKYDICKYICNHLKLPHGGDKEIMNEMWGISYAFTPILAYIFSGLFMKFATFFTQNGDIILIAGRLFSVLCIIGYSYICIKISNKLFKGIYKWLFVVLATLLPQLIYLGTYINNDSLALFSIAIIIYAWIQGFEKDWNWKSCVMLGMGIGICALSYYNAYGYILTSIFIYIISCGIKKINIKEFLKKGIVIAAIATAIAGWWFIRSYIIYDGDFLGLNTSKQYSQMYAIEQLKPTNRATPANEHISLIYMLKDMQWIKISIQSMIGIFGYMNIIMDRRIYIVYLLIIGLGIVGISFEWIVALIKKIHSKINNKSKEIITEKNIKNKEKILFNIAMIINIIIPIFLSIYYSYFNDFQPQGRYIMPIIIPLMYFITIGLKNICNYFIRNKTIRNIIIILLIIVWAIMPLYISFTYIVNNL